MKPPREQLREVQRGVVNLHSEEELLKKVTAHAAHSHGITEVTPELAAKVTAAIKTR